MSLRNKTLWSVLAQGITAGCNLFWFVFASRFFSPNEIGQFVVAVGIYSIVYTFTSFSPQVFLTQVAVCDDSVKSNCVGAAFVSLGVSTLIMLITVLILGQMSMDLVAGLVLVLMFKAVAQAFDVLPQGMLARHEMFKPLAIGSITTGIVNIISSVLLVEKFKTIEALAYAQVVSTFIGVVVTNYFARTYLVKRVSFNRLSELFRFARQMVSVNGIAYSAQKASELLIASLLGYAALGIYSRAVQISETVFQNVYAGFTRVAFSRMCNEYRDSGKCEQSYNMFREIIFIVVGALVINLAVLSYPLIYLVLGERWVEASNPLKVLLMAQLLIISYGMNWEVMVLHNQLKEMARFESIKSLILLVVIYGGSFVSLIGVSTGKLAEAAFGYVVYRKKIRELIDHQKSLLSRSTLLPLVASVLPTVAYATLPLNQQTSFLGICAIVVMSIGFWAAALWFDKQSIFHRMVSCD